VLRDKKVVRGWAVKVALNLLHEVSLGPAGPFYTYISQLPREFDVLSDWSDAELKVGAYTRPLLN
jgi:hypothetical protein